MKKLFPFLLVALLLVGCQNKTQQPLFVYSQCEQLFPTATNGDQFLFEISYDAYDMESALALFAQMALDASAAEQGGKCSSVWNPAGFHGRNLDFFINNDVDVVLHMAAAEGRFASVGMSSCYPKMSLDNVLTGALPEHMWDVLPLIMVDGINENGVSVNVNVVPANESTPIEGTNPQGKTLSQIFVVRYILDNAKSAAHAQQLLQELNIIGDPTHALPFEYHWMIADTNESFVAEIWNNQLVILPGETIMTNYFLSQPLENDQYGEGHERYAILKANYDEGATLEGMRRLMQRVYYSNTYRTDIDPIWYSECASMADGFNFYDFTRDANGARQRFQQGLAEASKAYVSVDHQKDLRAADNHNWYTTHSIVFDQHNRTMTISLQENEGSVNTFKIAK